MFFGPKNLKNKNLCYVFKQLLRFSPVRNVNGIIHTLSLLALTAGKLSSTIFRD